MFTIESLETIRKYEEKPIILLLPKVITTIKFLYIIYIKNTSVYIPIPLNIANIFTYEGIEMWRVLGNFPKSQSYQVKQTQAFDL